MSRLLPVSVTVILLVAGLLVTGAASVSAGTEATALRIGDHGGHTRFVLELSGPVERQLQLLADPYRVVLDLPDIEWKLPASVPSQGGLISGYRYGRFRPGTARVVLDTKGPTQVMRAFALPPRQGRGYRLVLDLAPISRAAYLAGLRRAAAASSGKSPAAAPTGPVNAGIARPPPAPPPPKPQHQIKALPMIVIDAGHGGVDSGALGHGGVKEKHLTLAAAHDLRRQLLATGRFRVAMTRSNDQFIQLRRRIAIARAKGADLFLSLHADSIGNRRVRGASVYTLSEKASDKEAADLAARENKADVIAGINLDTEQPEVVNILIDLAQRETMNESAVFARMLTDEVRKTGRLLRNSHRFAGFAVLKAPDVPSVLVEMGYLSNRTEARLLQDPAYRKRFNAAVLRAIDRYFSRQQALSRP